MDMIVLGTWQGVDPLQRTLEEFPLEPPENADEDYKIKPELEHCESAHNNIWLGKVVPSSQPSFIEKEENMHDISYQEKWLAKVTVKKYITGQCIICTCTI